MSTLLAQIESDIRRLEQRRRELQDEEDRIRTRAEQHDKALRRSFVAGEGIDQAVVDVTQDPVRIAAIADALKDVGAQLEKLEERRAEEEKVVDFSAYEKSLDVLRNNIETLAANLANLDLAEPKQPKGYVPSEHAKHIQDALKKFRKSEIYPALVELKKTAAKTKVMDSSPEFVKGKPMVKLADLRASRLCASDDAGNFFYLEEIGHGGEYLLRVVPKA